MAIGTGSSAPALEARRRATAYFALAGELFRNAEPRLLAIGGVSGTGKSTLAAFLAPYLGAHLGARVLRSDVVRKQLHGVAPEAPLPESAYGPEQTVRVYEALRTEADRLLAAGCTVIVDATFLDHTEQDAIKAVAQHRSVPFAALWLEAADTVLVPRLSARVDDASDATPAVLARQRRNETGAPGWADFTSDCSIPTLAFRSLRYLARLGWPVETPAETPLLQATVRA
jgi:predicted kinase